MQYPVRGTLRKPSSTSNPRSGDHPSSDTIDQPKLLSYNNGTPSHSPVSAAQQQQTQQQQSSLELEHSASSFLERTGTVDVDSQKESADENPTKGSHSDDSAAFSSSSSHVKGQNTELDAATTNLEATLSSDQHANE